MRSPPGVSGNDALPAAVTAPSTGAIIVSLPLNKAGVGSAVNDTTRELGGALGVAVLGSLIASLYRADLPASAHAATTSLGAGLEAATQLPGSAGAALAHSARAAYVHAFDITMLVAVSVALLTAALVWVVLRPAEADEIDLSENVDTIDEGDFRPARAS